MTPRGRPAAPPPSHPPALTDPRFACFPAPPPAFELPEHLRRLAKRASPPSKKERHDLRQHNALVEAWWTSALQAAYAVRASHRHVTKELVSSWLAAAIAAGRAPRKVHVSTGEEVPTPPSHHRNLKRLARPASDNTVDSYLSRDLGGVKGWQPSPALAEYLGAEARRGDVSDRALYARIKEKAESFGEQIPGFWAVRRLILKARSAPGMLAAQFGRAAVLHDGVEHGVVVVPYAHHTWVLDEFVLPVYCKIADPDTGTLVHTRPVLILIVDQYSGVIVSYGLAVPPAAIPDASASSQDIIGTLYSAFLPEIASKACRQYAGHLPEVVRWDRATTHQAARVSLEMLRIAVPFLPPHTPYRRGLIEVTGRLIKMLCRNLVRSEATYSVAEASRRQSLEGIHSALTPIRSRTPIRVEDLPTMQEVAAAVDEMVDRLNKGKRRRIRTSPHCRYLESPPARSGEDSTSLLSGSPRRGIDAVRLLPTHHVKVAKGGVVIHDTPFWVNDGRGLSVPVGTKVLVSVDPLLRGAWLHDGSVLRFLAPKYAAEPNRDPLFIAQYAQRQASYWAELAEVEARQLAGDHLGDVRVDLAVALAKRAPGASYAVAREGIRRRRQAALGRRPADITPDPLPPTQPFPAAPAEYRAREPEAEVPSLVPPLRVIRAEPAATSRPLALPLKALRRHV